MTTYREQSGLPPWFPQPSPLAAKLPPMEPLQPNPRYRPALPPMEPLQPNPNHRSQATPRAASRQPTSRKGPGHQGPSRAALQAQARSQPRDDEGRFAEKGGWFKNRWNAWLDPTPRPPTRLKKRPAWAAEQRSFSEIRTTAPARRKAKKRKKPVPERGFIGRAVSLFNGDYTRWRMANLRQQARLRAQAEGYYVPPKKRVRRRKPRPTMPAQRSRKRGIVRRLLGF